jgi:hypothetical protein
LASNANASDAALFLLAPRFGEPRVPAARLEEEDEAGLPGGLRDRRVFGLDTTGGGLALPPPPLALRMELRLVEPK